MRRAAEARRAGGFHHDAKVRIGGVASDSGETDAGAQATTILAKAGGLQTVALPTALVQKWISEKAANHGLIIAGSHREFDSLAISSAGSPARL